MRHHTAVLPRLAFAQAVLQKVVGWLLIALGLLLAVRAFLNGDVFIGLLFVFILIPIALWGLGLISGVIGVLVVWPLSMAIRARRELAEFTSLQLAVVEAMGADRLLLTQGREILRVYEQLPPPPPGVTRSPAELVAVAEEVGGDLARFGTEAGGPDEPSRSRSTSGLNLEALLLEEDDEGVLEGHS